jgi:hypothetical protein
LDSTSQLNVEQIAAVLASLDRRKLDTFTAVAIHLMDAYDQPSDPDAPDFSPACDGRPGSPDDEEPDDDAKGDPAWVEWHTMRGAEKRGPNIISWNEDAEDDDGGGDCTDDEPGFDKGSRLQANIRGHGWLGGGGAWCPINGDVELNGDEGDYGGEVDGI